MKFQNITRTVWLLSLVSLFTDAASEMLYPIMPIYLKQIGFSIVLIGILEGVAEAVAGFSKGYFGKLSDHYGRRVPFVQFGYALSAISKPMMSIFIFPIWIFFARTLDRLGKGIRTGARDALLSDEATPQTKGEVFGFHRAMDTTGAVIGPLLALIYLHYYPSNYASLFLIAFLPGIVAVLFSFILKEKSTKQINDTKRPRFFSFVHYWKESPMEYKRLVTGLLLFTLINSSDIFLLLKAKDAGLSDSNVIEVYIFYNLIYALFSYSLGKMGDKVGLKNMYIVGLTLFAIVYFGMGLFTETYQVFILFILYGIYAASTEGISKAWISNLIDRKDTSTGIGAFTAFQSISATLASSIAGIVWFTLGPTTLFLIAGSSAFVLILYFSSFTHEKITPKI